MLNKESMALIPRACDSPAIALKTAPCGRPTLNAESQMSAEELRKRERDQLFQSLHHGLPDDEKNRLKEYAKKTLQDKPPTMNKITVTRCKMNRIE